MKKRRYLRMLSLMMAIFTLIGALAVLSSCMDQKEEIKIGVLREDDSSGEAAAWESYLKAMAKAYGMTVDFTTTNSSASEVAAINTYASKGYSGILLFSDDDIVASVNAAAAKRMYLVYPTGYLTDAQYEQLKNNEYFLGAVAPSPDTEFAAGYDMARYFVEEKQQTAFTVFGGATSFGADMHIQRLSGMLAYLCEDAGTTYDGVSARAELVAKVSGKGIDPSKFKSDRYRITGYMDGFSFDDAFSTKLTASLEAGGTCILSVGAGDAVAKIAYGITSSNQKIPAFLSGGVDAITEGYAECFDLGYTYDCGKFASAMGPGLVLMQSALQDKRIVDKDGMAPRIGMSYWVATSKQELLDMLKSDNATDGYCYNKAVLDHYIGNSYEELLKLCTADYGEAVAIHEAYNGGDGLGGTTESGSGSGASGEDRMSDPLREMIPGMN